jgi:hypothetical protein
MISTCGRCGTTVGTPEAVGFVTTGLPASFITGLACALLDQWSRWLLLLSLPLWLLIFWLFWEGPRWWVILRNRFRFCPRCGGRDWSRPHYGGFGL